MTININPGVNYINNFPGSEDVLCSTYDAYLKVIYLSAGFAYGVLAYVPGDMFPAFTSFCPGSGIYIVEALSSFQIEYN